MKKSTSFLLLISVLSFACWRNAVSQEKVEISFWAQFWYQYVENGKNSAGLNDFMARRVYFYIKGQPANHLSFFTHIAVDRYGQDDLDNQTGQDNLVWTADAFFDHPLAAGAVTVESA